MTHDRVVGKFTCEFITPLSTFDTKVNLEIDAQGRRLLTETFSSLIPDAHRADCGTQLSTNQCRETVCIGAFFTKIADSAVL